MSNVLVQGAVKYLDSMSKCFLYQNWIQGKWCAYGKYQNIKVGVITWLWSLTFPGGIDQNLWDISECQGWCDYLTMKFAFSWRYRPESLGHIRTSRVVWLPDHEVWLFLGVWTRIFGTSEYQGWLETTLILKFDSSPALNSFCVALNSSLYGVAMDWKMPCFLSTHSGSTL